MRAVVTRCWSARVTVDGSTVGELAEPGLLVLLGVHVDDTETQVVQLVDKLSTLRILDNEQSVIDIGAPVLLVSQFTLYGSVRKGRRPSWSLAAGRSVAEPLLIRVAERLLALGIPVETGVFGAQMQVESVNDGPFTVIIDTAELPQRR